METDRTLPDLSANSGLPLKASLYMVLLCVLFGATALHSFVFIMPVSGVFLGVYILNEPVTLNLVVSVCLVVTGLIVVNMQKKCPMG